MRVNPLTNYGFNPQKQISFGIIEDKGAEEIIQANAPSEFTFPILNSSKFFIFSSEGQKLKVRLDEKFLLERTVPRLLHKLKNDETLNFENPVETLRNFEDTAYTLMDYEDTSKPSLGEVLARAQQIEEVVSSPELEELRFQLRQEEREREELENWNRCMNDLAF